MRAAVVVIGLFLMLAQPALAEDEHPMGQKICALLADYALVARALAEESQVSNDQADAILKRIYLSSNPVILEMETGIRTQARSKAVPASLFSNTFLMACLVHQAQIEQLPGLIERKVRDTGRR